MASNNEGIGVATFRDYSPVEEQEPAQPAAEPAPVADVPTVVPPAEDRPSAEKPASRAATKKEI